MKNIFRVLCFFIPISFMCITTHAQNVGVGTSNPQTKLQINGALSFVTSTAAADTLVTIPDNVSIFRLSLTSGGIHTALSLTGPKEGQLLTIYNEDDSIATFAGQVIEAIKGAANFAYIDTGWRLITNNYITGATGPTGATGSAGATGPAGPSGTTGAAGPSGSNGTNGIDGTNGANGATGVTGPTGLTGTAGTNGSNGAAGATGVTGPTGLTGTAGTNGTNGAVGATGVTGPTGLTGTAGTNGAVGATGVTGPTGLTGTAGTNGTNGAVGATGITGPTGLTGSAGTNGTNGAVGATGVTGPTGLTGTAGTNGTNGAVGATGITGPTGLTGSAGTNGTNGAVGATGPTGPLISGTTGQTLYYNSTTWTATSNLYNDGTNLDLNTSGSGTVNLGTGSSNGTVSIGNSSNNINLPKLGASSIVLTDASKNLTSVTTLPVGNGGTGVTALGTVSAGSSKISLGGTPTSSTIQSFSIDVVPGNIDKNTLGGSALTTANGGTGQTSLGTVTAGSSKISLGGTPTSSTIQSFSIDVAPANIDKNTLGGSALTIANGGTGVTSLTTNGILYGGSTIGVTAAGATGDVLIGNTSAAPSWASITSAANGAFILNQTTQQATSNFNISGAGVVGTNLTVAGLTKTQTLEGRVDSFSISGNSPAAVVLTPTDFIVILTNGGTGSGSPTVTVQLPNATAVGAGHIIIIRSAMDSGYKLQVQSYNSTVNQICDLGYSNASSKCWNAIAANNGNASSGTATIDVNGATNVQAAVMFVQANGTWFRIM